ncbi:hypothetical protein R1sor_027505 [Riccia sorocarpa]|uniref:Uncharacterized protein n=1 Tax=Riccia sorocarpa TaxID=122646 RepID=A0ABD3GH93_9MARC
MDANACAALAVGDEQKHPVKTMVTTGDPQSSSSFDSEDEESFSQQQQQMGSGGRRDARVVCETTGRNHDFLNGSAANSRHMNSSDHKWRRSNHLNRRAFANSYSRNPLLVCFIGESVLSQRSIRLHPNSDSANSQKASFFTLIPVDNSRINEKTGEPSSPQLSCMGQVKCRSRQVKACSALAQDIAQLELSCDRPKFGTSRKSFNRGRTSFDFAAAIADIPHLDLNEGEGAATRDAEPECPRLMRSMKRASSLQFASLTKGQATTDPPVKHSNPTLNQLLKQLLRLRSLFRFSGGFICGWNSRDFRDGDEVCSREKDERRGSIGEHYEIDLSRFASCDMQANTPSFLETRGHLHGKKLADIHVSQKMAAAVDDDSDGEPSDSEEKLSEEEVPNDERFSYREEKQEFMVPAHSTIVIKLADPSQGKKQARAPDRIRAVARHQNEGLAAQIPRSQD